MTDWTIAQARRTYSVPHWSEGYVDVDEAGDVVVRPSGAEGPALSLPARVMRSLPRGPSLRLKMSCSESWLKQGCSTRARC